MVKMTFLPLLQVLWVLFANTSVFFFRFACRFFLSRHREAPPQLSHVLPFRTLFFTGAWVALKFQILSQGLFSRAISSDVWLTLLQVRSCHRGQTLQVEVSWPAPDDGETVLHSVALVRASWTVLHEVHAVFTLQEIRPSLSCLNEVILTNHGD